MCFTFSRRTFLKMCAGIFGALGLSAFPQSASAKTHALPWKAPTAGASFDALIFADAQSSDASFWSDTLQQGFKTCPKPAFFSVLGDLVDNGEAMFQWEAFLAPLKSHATPFVPVLGNHECYGLHWKPRIPLEYLTQFIVPPAKNLKHPRYYFSFDCGNAHFIVLNTQKKELGALVPHLFEDQKEWLKEDLRSHRKQWSIVLMHKDILAYDEEQEEQHGRDGFSDTAYEFCPIFDEFSVDLVLTGHMHDYRNHGRIKDFKRDPAGTLYVMSGPAGDQFYHVPQDALDLAAGTPKTRNFLLLRIEENVLTVTAFETSGKKIETITLTR